MTIPVIYGFRRWLCDRDPLSNEVGINVPIEKFDMFQNSATGSVFLCTDETENALRWRLVAGVGVVVNRSIVTAANQLGFQISSFRPATAVYSIDLTASAILSACSTIVVAEIAATNSVTPSDWTEVQRITLTQSLTITSSQTTTSQLIVPEIPTGYFLRLRQIVSGTGSASYRSGIEKY